MEPDNRRRHARYQVDLVAWLTWTDANGRSRSIRGRCLDVSLGGMRLQTHCPVPQGARVKVDVPSQGVVRAALVRHCRPEGQRFFVGLDIEAAARQNE